MRNFFTIIFYLSIGFSNPKVKINEATIHFTGSHPFHDWTGISTQLDLEMNCSKMDEICDFIFTIPWTSFNSGNDNRDNNMLYYISAFDYPKIEMEFKDVKMNELTKTKNVIIGNLSMAGEKQNIAISLDFKQNDNQIILNSEFNISLTNYNIERPTLLMIPIKDIVNIHVNIVGDITQIP